MKVLLIAPTSNYKHHYPSFVPFLLFPTGLAYLASALKEGGHEVFGLNPNNITGYQSAHAMVSDMINKVVQEVKPNLIGIGGLCTDYAFIKDAMQIIRRVSPEIPIVLGGGIVTNDAEYIFSQLRPDFGVIGEGEEIIVQLTDMLENGNRDYDKIPNICYWEKGAAKFTKQDFNYGDIDLRPFPDYEPFRGQGMMDDYVMTAAWWYRYTRPYPRPWVIVTARSCPFSCTFCVHQRGPKYRARSIVNIIQEIKVSYDKYHFNILIVMDELFAVNKARMREFCTALLEARRTYKWDFDWSFQTHASAALDRATLEPAKQAGCFSFSYGLESASSRVLKSMNKKTRPSQIVEAIRLANDVGLCFGGNFIFGDVAETEDTAFETIDFMVRHCLDNNILLAALRPYPGSKVFETCLIKGLIKDKLDFYEHIDENPWNMKMNMTSMPDKVWLPLLDSIVAFGQLFPWMKSAFPYRYEVDSEATNSPIVLHTGKQIYKIWFKCPHCGMDIYCRELLALDKGVKPEIEVTPNVVGEEQYTSFSEKVITGVELIKNAVVKAARLSNLYYFSFRHPIYKLLRSSVRNRKHDLFWDSFIATVFFISDCPHCHKAIKVVIPIPFTIKAFSFMEIKRRFKLA